MLRMRGVVVFVCVLVGLLCEGVRGEDAQGFVEEQIRFAGTDGFELRGTLLLPREEVPEKGFAALLLLPGSGPTDRDGNQPPFLVTNLLKTTAERLAEAGIATLRFDKRAAHVYMAEWAEKDVEALNAFFGWDHFVGDAAAAYRVMVGREEVDGSRAGMFGHSEGGLIALCSARVLRAEGVDVAGLVLAGTAGRRLDVVMRDQLARQVSRDAEGEAFLEEFMRAAEAVRETGRPPEDLSVHLRMLFPPSAMDVLRAYFTVDPIAHARAYPGPVLVINGEMDVQVLAEKDFVLLRDALAERGEGSVEAVIVERASHNFKRVERMEDPGIFGPVVEEFLDAVVEWAERVLTAPRRDRGGDRGSTEKRPR